MWRKLLPMLPMSNVSPTASTWYLTGVLFCKAAVMQQGQQLFLHYLELLCIQQKFLLAIFTLDSAGMQLDPTGTNTTALAQPHQPAPKIPMYLKGNVSRTRLGDTQGATLALPQISYARNLAHGLDQTRQ